MAAKRKRIPRYSSVEIGGHRYYRTFYEDAEGKSIALYGKESVKKSADNFSCRFLKPSSQIVGKILVGNKMWNKLSLNARKQGVLDRFKEMDMDEHVS